MPYDVCMKYLANASTTSLFVEPDWEAYNKKKETLKLISDAGGLTTNMKAFMRVYEGHVWKVGSGGGSRLDFASRSICILQHALIAILNATVLLDIPCGDQQWSPTLRSFLPTLKYIGVDGMPGLVQVNRERFGHGPGGNATEFFLGDMTDPDLFRKIKNESQLWKPSDRVVVLSRHVLQHNSYDTIFSYLHALRLSGAMYFIGTTATSDLVQKNPAPQQMTPGGYHPINFHLPPFNFPHGIFQWLEQTERRRTIYRDVNYLETWPVESIPTTFSS